MKFVFKRFVDIMGAKLGILPPFPHFPFIFIQKMFMHDLSFLHAFLGFQIDCLQLRNN